MVDSNALHRFVATGSQEAFREMVDAHIDMVYAAARRQVRDAHLAEDVTQNVFVILSRKAASISSAPMLSAWLLGTTRLVCRNAIRDLATRRRREQEAAMQNQSISQEPVQ